MDGREKSFALRSAIAWGNISLCGGNDNRGPGMVCLADTTTESEHNLYLSQDRIQNLTHALGNVSSLEIFFIRCDFIQVFNGSPEEKF
jgi:hypothetical protein